MRGHTTVCVEAGLYRGCLRVCHSKYSYQRVSNYLLYGQNKEGGSEKCRRDAPGLGNHPIHAT